MIYWFSETPEFVGELPERADLKQHARYIARHFFPPSQSASRKGFETPMTYLPAMANTSKVLQGRAQAELAAGRPENAFQDVQTILALARAAGSAPFLITVLVESSILDRASQVICDGLERHAWTDAQLADLSSELSHTDLLAR